MGIFKEDLLRFGNLIDKEIEVKLPPEHLKNSYENLEFVFGEGILIIRGKKAGFLKRKFEITAVQEKEVYTKGVYKTEDLGIYLRITAGEKENIVKTQGIFSEKELLGLSVWEALRKTDVYRKIPDPFKERIFLKRYRLTEGFLHLTLGIRS